jgi:L-ascorbate metabolism protein UlaG (beta-lactamase superfamily)
MKMTLIIIVSLLLLFFAGSMLLGWIFSAPVYHGPITDHFDGKKFINPGNVKEHGFKDLMKWMRTREKGEWKEQKDLLPGAPPPPVIQGDSVRVTFVNHSTFLIQTMGLNILTDPIWSERASPVGFSGPKRIRPPGIRYEDLPGIDIILLTHNHYDHLDISTLKKLARDFNPVIYCPLGVDLFLEKRGISNTRVMDWWDELQIGDDISIICTPAQHFSGRGMFDRNKTLWCGFALQTASGAIYYSGDTGYGGFFKDIAMRIGPLRLAFIPIGAYKPEWFMAPIHTSPEDALKVFQDIGSPPSIGMHFGTFPLADDAMNEPVMELERLKAEKGIGENDFIVMKEGEVIEMR